MARSKTIPETGDEAELMAYLWKAVREKNNVPAMRILLTEMRRDGQNAEETSVIDELAAKRAKSG